MVQTWNLEIAVFRPMHVIFERRSSSFYKLGKSALPTPSLLAAEGRIMPTTACLWERRESNSYEPGENALLAAPHILNGAAPGASAPYEEGEIAEHMNVVPAIEPEARPVVLTQVKFRQALIEVDNPEVFWDGIVGGQVAAVEEQQPLSGTQIFALFEDAVRDLEFSETWLAGYLLGLSDALLRQRKMYPRTYTTLLNALK